ncbi:MAG: phosphoenolpyruvate carboxykinase (ATP), partial [Candidatus Sungbacteria bacterium]|nr:phosphoenolpyruvate carboxykinase (ATP) [Candidatus Sungbacteria bacterium]
EGGCYAKVIRLSRQAEPQIYEETKRFGTILENVVMDEATRMVNLDDASLTENTRAAYTIRSLPNAYPKAVAPHPSHIFMLTCDAFGVLPPLSKLTLEQAVYHFLLGYTAKLAGTERGIEEPQATFSPCFGAPFLPLPPSRYAKLLKEKIAKNNVQCWLVNTGWTGGSLGVGKRIAIVHTRQMIQAAIQGLLASAPTKTHPIFGIDAIQACPGVPSSLLDPRVSWSEEQVYDKKAKDLATLFSKNALTFK